MLKPYQTARALFVILSGVLFSASGRAQDLRVALDDRGISQLSFRGIALIDLKAGRGDGFSVGAYKLGGKQAWGGTGYQASWDAKTNRLTWSWSWGSAVCEFQPDQSSSTVRLGLTVTNRSREALEGINLYPFGLQFPQLPAGFGAPNYPQFRNGVEGPPALLADFRIAALALVHREATPLYLGLSPSGPANHYRLQVGTLNDDTQGFLSRAVPLHRAVAPGATDRYTIELRFTNAGQSITNIAADVLKRYAELWPAKLLWTDRRPIGELFLTDPVTTPRTDSEPNPRNYIVAKDTDVHTSQGKARFREAVLSYADQAVRRLKSMNAQGAIVWDLEGQQYPQPDTSYVGDPASLAKLSPEMDAVADDFFRRFTQAGLKCGLTIRPQRLDFSTSPPRQMNVPAADTASVMISRMRYARERWGCTLFYVDSDGGPNDATTPSVFAEVLNRLPDVLIIPENIWPRDYAYTAPLASFTAPYKPLHTPAEIRAVWPRAFSVTYIGDAPGNTLKKNPELWKAFQEATARGDIIAFRAWFDDQPLNSQITELYRSRQ